MAHRDGKQVCPEIVEEEEKAQRRYEPIMKPPWFRDRRNAIPEPGMAKNVFIKILCRISRDLPREVSLQGYGVAKIFLNSPPHFLISSSDSSRIGMTFALSIPAMGGYTPGARTYSPTFSARIFMASWDSQ